VLPIRRIVQDLAAGACVTLFRSYGLRLVPVTDPGRLPSPLHYCGVMGYGGTGIRGSLAMGATKQILVASHPPRHEMTREWAGELANQLTGLVKSGLLGHGVEIHLSTPAVIQGDQLTLEGPSEARPLLFCDPTGTDGVGVWLDLEIGPSFVMASDEDQSLIGLASGEAIIF
jgi:hypothetical protein